MPHRSFNIEPADASTRRPAPTSTAAANRGWPACRRARFPASRPACAAGCTACRPRRRRSRRAATAAARQMAARPPRRRRRTPRAATKFVGQVIELRAIVACLVIVVVLRRLRPRSRTTSMRPVTTSPASTCFGVVVPRLVRAAPSSAGFFAGQGAQGLPSLVAHVGDRPVVLHGPFQPHLGVVPIEGGLKMAPEQAWIVIAGGGEPLGNASQAADVLRRDVPDAADSRPRPTIRRPGPRWPQARRATR